MRALALSGGGFRATLYHLGVIRSLIEKGELKKVEAICSVSGGSVLAAHLVMNWELYNDLNTFPATAKSILEFMQRDARGRVFRWWLVYRVGFILLAFATSFWACAIPRYFWQIAGVSFLLLTVGILWDPIWNPRWSRINLLIEE